MISSQDPGFIIPRDGTFDGCCGCGRNCIVVVGRGFFFVVACYAACAYAVVFFVVDVIAVGDGIVVMAEVYGCGGYGVDFIRGEGLGSR